MNLNDFLQASSNTSLPSVLDKDGTEVTYSGTNRITDETCVVDIGESPNSNTGDPLRTAFIKMNNIAEALYQYSLYLEEKVDDYETRISSVESDASVDGGSF